MSKPLIEPHGGTLIDRVLTGTARDEALARAETLPQLELSERSLADIECLAYGIYSPLTGFVSEADYKSIVDTMHLADGTVWSIPITLQVTEEVAAQYSKGSEIALTTGGRVLALMNVTDVYRPDQAHEAEQVYRTGESKHPGVAAVLAAGSVYLGGPISLVGELPEGEFDAYKFYPKETRAKFEAKGWHTIVAFQTRTN